MYITQLCPWLTTGRKKTYTSIKCGYAKFNALTLPRLTVNYFAVVFSMLAYTITMVE